MLQEFMKVSSEHGLEREAVTPTVATTEAVENSETTESAEKPASSRLDNPTPEPTEDEAG